jgi:hypothetical protein
MLENIELLEDRKPKQLTTFQLESLAGVISQKYDDWLLACQPHINEIKKIRKYIYQSQKGEHPEGDPYTLPSIYKLNEALKAHIKENVYPTNASVFDVKGDDEESQDTANLHKWDIVNDLEKMDFKHTKARAFLKSFNESGEMIALVGLSKKTIKRKTEVEVPQIITDEFTPQEISTTTIKIALEEIEVHDGVEVYPIKSEDFYFDTTKADRFDNPVCGKIIKKWLSYNEIINNKSYELLQKNKYGKETKEYLKSSIKNEEPNFDMLTQDTSIQQTKRQIFSGDQTEILEYWGNIVVDGIELNDYLITLAGNRVIRCEPNPYYNCCIVYYANDIHPDYKRGISPLRVALKSSDIATNITNEIVDAFPYIALPVSYVPKGAIVDKKEKPKPGGVIEYETDLNKNAPIPINVSGVLQGFNLIEFFGNQTEQAVGMSNAMLGAATEEKKTATEIKAVQVGGSIRVSEMIDGIKQGFNIPVIKKIADLKANFEEGEKPLGVAQGDGSVKQETVTDEVRKGKYHYTYIDSKASMERQAQFKEVLALLQMVLKVDPNAVNIKEIIKYGFTETGMQDVERFLQTDKLDEAIRAILTRTGIEVSPPIVEQAKEKIIPYLPMLAQRILQDVQQQRTQATIPNQGMGGMSPNIQAGGLPSSRGQ